MPKEHEKIEYLPGEKSLKAPFREILLPLSGKVNDYDAHI